MTIPEYDEECMCELCQSLRNKRQRRVKEEIEHVHAEHISAKHKSTGNDLLEDAFR
jgi:hypothetical protein